MRVQNTFPRRKLRDDEEHEVVDEIRKEQERWVAILKISLKMCECANKLSCEYLLFGRVYSAYGMGQLVMGRCNL